MMTNDETDYDTADSCEAGTDADARSEGHAEDVQDDSGGEVQAGRSEWPAGGWRTLTDADRNGFEALGECSGEGEAGETGDAEVDGVGFVFTPPQPKPKDQEEKVKHRGGVGGDERADGTENFFQGMMTETGRKQHACKKAATVYAMTTGPLRRDTIGPVSFESVPSLQTMDDVIEVKSESELSTSGSESETGLGYTLGLESDSGNEMTWTDLRHLNFETETGSETESENNDADAVRGEIDHEGEVIRLKATRRDTEVKDRLRGMWDEEFYNWGFEEWERAEAVQVSAGVLTHYWKECRRVIGYSKDAIGVWRERARSARYNYDDQLEAYEAEREAYEEYWAEEYDECNEQ
jgi:hypothetical protein